MALARSLVVLARPPAAPAPWAAAVAPPIDGGAVLAAAGRS